MFALALLFNQPLNALNVGQGIFIGHTDATAPVSMGIKTTAQSVLVAEITKDAAARVIYQKNPHELVPLASLTKRMSMFLLFEEDHHPDRITMSKDDEVKEERDAQRLDVVEGEEIAWNDLMRASLMFSANNAVKALVRAQGSSEEAWVKKMNARAQLWGMHDTHFADVTGMSPRNVSTAADILVLAQKAFAVPGMVEAGQGLTYTFIGKLPYSSRGVTIVHTDRSRKSFINNSQKGYRIVTSKTGFVQESGYHLVTKVSAKGGPGGQKNGKEIILVLLGSATSQTRFQEVKGLVWWAFEHM